LIASPGCLDTWLQQRIFPLANWKTCPISPRKLSIHWVHLEDVDTDAVKPQMQEYRQQDQAPASLNSSNNGIDSANGSSIPNPSYPTAPSYHPPEPRPPYTMPQYNPREVGDTSQIKKGKQSMADLKLRRLTELNNRLREDLERERIPVSSAAKR